MSHRVQPSLYNPRYQTTQQSPSNTHYAGSYSMTHGRSQDSNSSSGSGYTYQQPSPSSSNGYSPHANPHSSGSTSGSPPPPRHPCLYPGCLHTSARPYDLDRHLKTHFPEAVAKLDCPHARGGWCGREGLRGFTREDHRKEHVRKVHPVRR